MGRKLKQGIDYFNINVKYLEDYKIDKLNNEVGIIGIAVLHLFYSLVYYQGYYLEFDNQDYLIRLVNKYFYHDKLSNNEINKVINSLITCDLFTKELFSQSILTSKEIQEHYYDVTRKRKDRDFSLYWLLTKEEMKEIDSHSESKKQEYFNIFTGKNSISTSENKIITSENDVFTSESTQSKSKREREKEDKYDKRNFEIPNLHYLIKLLIKHTYIDNFDLDIMKYNNLFKELTDEYSFDKVCSCCNYIVRYSKRPSTDIDDKYDYFKASINNNLKMIEHRERNSNKTIEDWFTELVKLNKE